MNTTTVFSKGWIDIIFDGRNKAYGAYELRRINDRTLIAALMFSSAVAVGAALLTFNNGYNPKPPEEKSAPPVPGGSLLPPPIIEARRQPAAKQPQVEKPKTRSEFNFEIVDTLIEQVDTNAMVNHELADTGTSGDAFASVSGTFGDGDAGTGAIETDEQESTDPIDWTDEMPEFPGGHREFVKFISKNVEYLEIAREYGIEGTVYVGFVVEADGSITQVNVARGLFKPLDEEAVRVVKLMPAWKPGKQKGKPVRVRYKVPISFVFR